MNYTNFTLAFLLLTTLTYGFKLPDLSEVQLRLNSLWSLAFPPDNVIAVDSPNLADLIRSAEVAVVNFYSPASPLHKKLAPEYRKTATLLKETPSIVIAKCDVSKEVNAPLRQKYGIVKHPVLKIFRGGDVDSPLNYSGALVPEDMAAKLKLLTGPDSTELAHESDWRVLRDQSDVLVVGVFPKPSIHSTTTAFDAFLAAAAALRGSYRFAHTQAADVIPEYRSSENRCQTAIVLLYKPYDGGLSIYEGDFDESGLRDWIISHATPLVSELRKDTPLTGALREVYYSPLPRVFGITNKENESSVRKAMTDAAAAMDSMKFILVHGDVWWLLQHYGIPENQLPAFVIHDQQAKYVRTHFKAEECLAEWIREYEEGALQPYIKSEPTTVSEEDHLVQSVTANTFQEIVFSGRNVLLELYRPNCGACKRLEPHYTAAAERLEHEDVTCAKMSVAENDVPSDKFHLTHVPTIFFVTGATGDVIMYNGERTAGALTGFVTSQLQSLKTAASPQPASTDDSHSQRIPDEL